MSLNIIVCIKQVPHPDYLGKITLDTVRGTINREGIPAVVNPGDKNALEEALKLRERAAGTVIILTMGPPQAKKALEDALAMGADSGLLLCDRAFAGADSLATARALAGAIRRTGAFSLVLCGNSTVDSGTGQVPVQLAEMLGLPCATDVEEVTLESEQSVIVKRSWEHGFIRARVSLPAVLAVNERINQPRLATIFGIMAAARKEIKAWDAAQAGVELGLVGLSGSPTRMLEICEFHASRNGEVFQGTADEVVARAVDKLVRLELL